jgi:competence protein ComEA
MKQFIRDYLTFNKRERNGLFVLLLIIILLLVYLNTSDKFIKPETTDFSNFEKEIVALNAADELAHDSLQNDSITPKHYSDNTTTNNASNLEPEYFNFNPNNLPEEDWTRLGFSDKQIQTIKNYEAKGGRFRTKEDVKKMYCIREKQYNEIESYIQIPIEQKQTSDFEKFKSEIKTPKPEKPLVELNSADSAYLTKVKGIGPFYAKSIVKYRTALGGFAFKEQLMEIWKFDQEKFDAVKDFVFVDDSEIKKININTCTATELKHPYLNWNMVNAIVSYRNMHGNYKRLEEIKNTDLVDDETYRKIVVYLTL